MAQRHLCRQLQDKRNTNREQTGTHEDGLVDGGQFVDTIHEVGAALYHTLVDKFLERLFLAAHAVVVEELIPETGVDKVTGGMLRTGDLEVII